MRYSPEIPTKHDSKPPTYRILKEKVYENILESEGSLNQIGCLNESESL